MTQPPPWPGIAPGHPEPEPTPVPAGDFLDAPAPAAAPEFPPVGAYPGEPGHPGPDAAHTQVIPAVPADAAHTQVIPAVPADADATQVIPEVPAWQRQAPPSEPWHARHEKPGEWRYEPPEHLAYQHSPPAELHTPNEPIWTGPQPQVVLPPQRRRRGALWVGLALAVTLLLCGGGAASAYYLLRDAGAPGAADPAGAVDTFLTAVYTQQDPKAAGESVCRQAEDAAALTARVDQIKGYANEYDAPVFRWSTPAVSNQTKETATVAVQLTLSTDDEKSAQQQLTFTTVHKNGWFVCEITG